MPGRARWGDRVRQDDQRHRRVRRDEERPDGVRRVEEHRVGACPEPTRRGCCRGGVRRDAAFPATTRTGCCRGEDLRARPERRALRGLRWPVLRARQGLQLRGLPEQQQEQLVRRGPQRVLQVRQG